MSRWAASARSLGTRSTRLRASARSLGLDARVGTAGGDCPVEVVRGGWSAIGGVVTPGPVSDSRIEKVIAAPSGSLVPAASIAWTLNRCSPGASAA